MSATEVLLVRINGEDRALHAHPAERLVDVLRHQAGITSVKEGCGTGQCGSCTVLLDGRPIVSCLTFAGDAVGHEITTVEALSTDGKLHPLQQAFIEHGAVQCGFCTPGMLLAAKALLDEIPRPSEEEIRRGLAGNLCRCTGYAKIIEAIQAVAGAPRRAGKGGVR
jgi:aerobic carbon-monoxide dehydrogenase small subunit